MNGGICVVNVGKYTIYGCVMGFDTWSWLLVAIVLCVFLHARSVTVIFVVEDPQS